MATLPVRSGPRPSTYAGIPHQQLDQQPPDARIRDALATRLFSLPGVTEGPSGISVPGARALLLDPTRATGPREAFFLGQEFAHLHPADDQSLHACLPDPLADEACRNGWAELHPLALTGQAPRSHVMVYAPRDDEELEVVAGLIEASYRFATGDRSAPTLRGFRHVALSVSDLDRSVAWYQDVLGFSEMFRESGPERSAVILGIPGTGVVVGLVHFSAGAGDRFSPQRTGLDHLCFTVDNRDELEAWIARLESHGVTHSGMKEMRSGSMVNFKDPDGIALAVAGPLR